jgi:hypothetical protein
LRKNVVFEYRCQTIRKLSRPSTAQCNLDEYVLFLLSEPKQGGCCRLSELLPEASHDSVNRFLLRERYEAKDLFETCKSTINLIGGILSVDDTVIEKLYSNPKKAELISYFWSGKYHKTIKGVNLITLYYSDADGRSMPVNYRIYDKEEAKKYSQVNSLEIPESGLVTHLRNFGFIKLYRKDFRNEGSRHYILYLPDETALEKIEREDFLTIHDTHWGIECFHRAVKQVCGMCRFMVRDSQAIKTHVFCSLQAFVRLEKSGALRSGSPIRDKLRKCEICQGKKEKVSNSD